MDYVSIIILIVVTFIFLSDRKIKSQEEIFLNKEIKQKTKQVKQSLDIIQMDMNKLKYSNLKQLLQNSKNKYILIIDNELKLNDYEIMCLIANFCMIQNGICGFNANYELKSKMDKNKTLKEKLKVVLNYIYIYGINYLNIFNKYELSSYAVLFVDKDKLDVDTKTKKECEKNIISFIPSRKTNIKYSVNRNKNVKKLYLDKIKKGNKRIILRVIFLIIAGSYITANLLSKIFNYVGFTNLLISVVIYLCYSYIIRYIYEPLGSKRFLASYIFPIYMVIYVCITIYDLMKNINGTNST